MNHLATEHIHRSKAYNVTYSDGILQRVCACGKHTTGQHGECTECRNKRTALQRRAVNQRGPETAPPIVHDVLRSSGRPLDDETRSFMESRFNHDFSQVRVHTDGRAGESALAVNALAYTVGNHVAFGAGQYLPGNSNGRRLLMHELAHVIQQRNGTIPNPIPIGPACGALEAAAEGAATDAATMAYPTAVGQLQRQSSQTTPRYTGCTPGKIRASESARRAAAIRCQTARFQVSGIVPPGPGHPETMARMSARGAVLRIFRQDLNMEQVGDIIGNMGSRLASPSLSFVCAPASDRLCGNRAGYVVGYRSPVHLCPAFFNHGPEERIRTMVHEAAHLSRIGEPQGESYCPIFDCETSCGGFDVADSWSHLVHCLSGRTPDEPETVTGQRPPQRRR